MGFHLVDNIMQKVARFIALTGLVTARYTKLNAPSDYVNFDDCQWHGAANGDMAECSVSQVAVQTCQIASGDPATDCSEVSGAPRDDTYYNYIKCCETVGKN